MIVNVRDYLVLPDVGDITANLAAALAAVSAAGGGVAYITDGGTYDCVDLPFYSDVVLYLGKDVSLSKIRSSRASTVYGGDGTTYVINAAGSVTGIGATLTADADALDMAVSASSTWAAVGDIVLIRDDTFAYSVAASAYSGGTVPSIVSVAAGNPAVVTANKNHLLNQNNWILIAGNSDSAVNGLFQATPLTDTTFSIAATSAGGSGGTVTTKFGRNQQINRVISKATGSITLAHPLLGAYTQTSNAVILKLDTIKRAAILGEGQIIVPVGSFGGCMYGDLLYDCKIGDGLDIVGPYARPGVRLDESAWCEVAYATMRDGQGGASGNNAAFGIQGALSSHNLNFHHLRISGCNENDFTGGVRQSVFEDSTVEGGYNGFNTHGSGNAVIGIRRNKIHNMLGSGITVSFSIAPYIDSDVDVSGNDMWAIGGHGISAIGSSGKVNTSLRMFDNAIKGFGQLLASSVGIFATFVNGLQMGDNNVSGNGNASATYAYRIEDATTVDIAGGSGTDVTNGFGMRYANVTGFKARGMGFRNNLSYNVQAAGTNVNDHLDNIATDDTTRDISTVTRLTRSTWGTLHDENTGTATVASGATTVTVTHGLSGTPSIANIQLTPQNSLGNASRAWASTITATTFVINVDVAPGATTAIVTWRATMAPA